MLLPDQIPSFWDSIKFAVVRAELLKPEKWDRYLNRLLYSLLSAKAQCFVRLDNDRRLQMLGLTTINVDSVNDEKTLFCYSLYSFAKAPIEVWKSDYEDLVRWAKANDCRSITTWSNNEKAISLFKAMGMSERLRMYYISIGGV